MKNVLFLLIIFFYLTMTQAQVQEIWRASYTYQQQEQFLKKITVDQDHNILMAITSKDSTFLDNDAIVVKVDKAGNVVWDAVYDTDTTLAFLHYYEKLYDLAVDEENNVYILGYEWVNTPESWRENLFLMKYNAEGERLWLQKYHRGERSQVQGLRLQLHNNELWVTGRFVDNGTQTFWFGPAYKYNCFYRNTSSLST